VPIVLFWNLSVQDGFVLPYVFALFFSDLGHDRSIVLRLCIVEDIKIDCMTFPVRLCQNAVFLLCWLLDGGIVLRDAFKHIVTLSDVNNGFVNLYAVNTRVFVLICKTVPFQPVVCFFFVSCH